VLLLSLAACTELARVDAPRADARTIVPLGRAGLTVELLAAGVRVSGGGELELRTMGWGRGDDLVEAPVPTLPLGATWPGSGAAIAEWWRTVPFGVEQGWTIVAPPPGRDELAIHVAVVGAEGLVERGAGARFADGSGRRWEISAPTAVDARGRRLPARLAVEPDGFVVHVDDTGARYPIVVDPVYSSPTTTLTGGFDATLGAFASSVAVGDLDGDRYADLVVGTTLDGTGGAAGIHVFPGSATGVSTSPSAGFTTTSEAVGGSLSLGDIDCDGALDVVTGAVGVRVFRGHADGTIDAAAYLNLLPAEADSGLGRGVAAADVDGDGCDEVVVGAWGVEEARGAVYVYDGGAAAVTTIVGPVAGGRFGYSLGAIGDFDGDGSEDVQIAAPDGDSGVYLGSPAGLAAGRAYTFTCGDCTDDLGAVGDLDNDGFDDFVSGDPSAMAEAGQFVVTYGAASGTGGMDTVVGASAGVRLGGHWVSGDFDGDGVRGLAVKSGALDVRFYPGDGGGIASVPVQIVSGRSSSSSFYVRSGDLDGDGDDDLLLVEPGAHVEVFLGGADADGDGVVAEEDCDDTDATVQVEGTRYRDEDRDGFGDPAAAVALSCGGDGTVADATDCDDTNLTVHPGGAEAQGDERDSDCDGTERCFSDMDEDGTRPYPEDDPGVLSTDLDCTDFGEATAWSPPGDCDDSDPARSPSQVELIADGIDQDCDGVDSCFTDADEDGWSADGVETGTTPDCSGPGERLSGLTATGDCDDADPTVHPEAEEIVDNGIDSDCDGAETCYLDADGDGHRPDATSTVRGDLACSGTGQATADAPADDCDDTDPSTWPGASEVEGDGLDQDCDGADSAGVGEGCGCAAAPSSVTGWVLLGLGLGVVGRRRRPFLDEC
jgi:MYXO-CTERM domain-containing protein